MMSVTAMNRVPATMDRRFTPKAVVWVSGVGAAQRGICPLENPPLTSDSAGFLFFHAF
jgi:hypothetical protein